MINDHYDVHNEFVTDNHFFDIPNIDEYANYYQYDGTELMVMENGFNNIILSLYSKCK